MGWARVWPAAKPAASRDLRKGAWYAVLLDREPATVVLDIGGKPALVPRRLLQIREAHAKPNFFAVVHRTAKELARTRESPRGSVPIYAVCPRCSCRQPVRSREPETRCPKCRFLGEVAWWEIE